MARPNKGVRAVLLGPDNKHGARPTKGHASYMWYAEWYDRGRRRLRALNRKYGEDYAGEFERVRSEVSTEQVGKVKNLTDAKLGVVLAEYLVRREPEVIDARGLIRRVEVLSGFFRDVLVSELDRDHCERFAASRPSAGTARLELGTLASAINLAVERRIITTKPPTVWRPADPPPKDRVLSRSEIASLVRHWRRRASSRHYAVATLVAYRTAGRIQSVLALGWRPSPDGGHVDMARGLVALNPEGRALTKKRKPTLPLPAQLRSILEPMRRNGRSHVCSGLRGVPPGIKVYEREWRNACKLLGIVGATPHALRHSRITHLIVAGHPPALVGQFVGLSVQTLMHKYAHVIPNHLGKIADTR